MTLFAGIELVLGVAGLSTIVFFRVLPLLMYKELHVGYDLPYDRILFSQFLIIGLYILLPGILIGAAFPLAAKLYIGETGRVGKGIGVVLALNSAGAIIGTVLCSFYMIPAFGTTVSLKTAALLNIVIGLGGFLLLKNKRLIAVSLAAAVLVFLPFSIPFPALDTGVPIYGAWQEFDYSRDERTYLYQKEGLVSTISVTATRDGNIQLRANGKVDASTGSDMSTQLALGYFPMLMHRSPRDVLVIGMGSGVTVKAVSEFSTTQNIDVVEIEPAVMGALGFFRDVNGAIYKDKRVHPVIEDARTYLAVSRSRYDMIISEPSNPWISGIGNLYSHEFYAQALTHLNEGGVYCQWVQLYGLLDSDLRMIVRTFGSVFPDMEIWQSHAGDIMLIGYNSRTGPLHKAYVNNLTMEAVRTLRSYLGVFEYLDLYGYFVTDADGARAFGGEAPVNTDDLPLLEFSAPRSLYLQDVLPRNNRALWKFMKNPFPAEMPGVKDSFAEFLFLKSRLYDRQDIPMDDSWMETALSHDADNPVYRLMKAKLLLKKNDTAGAQEILASLPDSAAVLLERALVRRMQGDMDATAYEKLADDIDDRDFAYALAEAKWRFEQDDYGEALSYFGKALSLPHQKGFDGQILGDMGFSYASLNQPDQAARYLTSALKSNPYGYKYRNFLGQLYGVLGDRSSACQTYRDAQQYAFESDEGDIREKMSTYCSD